MQKASLIQLQREVARLKKSVSLLTSRVSIRQTPIIIEKIDDIMLTPKERKRMQEALDNLKHGKKDRFVTLTELKTRYNYGK